MFAPSFYKISDEWTTFENQIGGFPALDISDPVAGRAKFSASLASLPKVPSDGVRKQDSSAHNIPIRIYTPLESSGAPYPVVVYYHGGGFVLGDLESEDGYITRLCRALKWVFVSVNYRHAPEHPYPAAVDDSYEAFEWVANNAKSLDADPSKIFVMGASAGGNLSANVTIRDHKLGKNRIKGQLLNIPSLLHNENIPEKYKDKVKSYTLNSTAPILPASIIKAFYGLYKPPTDDGACFPLYNDPNNFKGLPPTAIAICGADPLADEAKVFAEELTGQGVQVRVDTYPGLPHGFHMSCPIESAEKFYQANVDALRWFLSLAK